MGYLLNAKNNADYLETSRYKVFGEALSLPFLLMIGLCGVASFLFAVSLAMEVPSSSAQIQRNRFTASSGLKASAKSVEKIPVQERKIASKSRTESTGKPLERGRKQVISVPPKVKEGESERAKALPNGKESKVKQSAEKEKATDCPPLFTIYFNKGSVLREAYAKDLTLLSRWLKRHPNVVLVVNGYSDSHGRLGANYRLSRERASRVIEWMNKDGIPKKRMLLRAFGEFSAQKRGQKAKMSRKVTFGFYGSFRCVRRKN